MKVIYSEANGKRIEGEVLAAGKYLLRVVVPGETDVVELRHEYDQWSLENGNAVTLESFITDSASDVSVFAREMFPLTRAAGSLREYC